MSLHDPLPELTCDDIREMAGAFVLGALEPAEDAAVRAHLADCTDAHAEIDELGGVLPALGESVPRVEPPIGLKARIMAAAAADLGSRHAGPVPATTMARTAALESPASASASAATVPIPFPTVSEREARRSGTAAGWILRIAAVLAIVALGGWNLLLQGQLDTGKSYQQSVAAVLDVAAMPGSVSAILAAEGGSGAGLAAVDYRGAITLAMQDLAPTTGDAVYEAWAIRGDGPPVPLGSFKVGNARTAFFAADGAPRANGVILALTLEPGPGATTPTLPIVSKGVASAPS